MHFQLKKAKEEKINLINSGSFLSNAIEDDCGGMKIFLKTGTNNIHDQMIRYSPNS